MKTAEKIKLQVMPGKRAILPSDKNVHILPVIPANGTGPGQPLIDARIMPILRLKTGASEMPTESKKPNINVVYQTAQGLRPAGLSASTQAALTKVQTAAKARKNKSKNSTSLKKLLGGLFK